MASFKHKLVLLLVGISFVSLALLSAYNIHATIRDNEIDLQEYREALYSLFDIRIKSQVETAHSLIAPIYRQQQAGLFSETEAKKRATDLIRGLRFEFAIEAAENAIFDLDIQTNRYNVPPNWGKNLRIPDVSNLEDYVALVHPDNLARRAGPIRTNLQPHQDAYAKEYRVRSLSGDYI